MIIITPHAAQRIRERLNLAGDAAERTVEQAFTSGLQVRQTRGKLRRYLDRCSMQHGHGNFRIWGRFVFVFHGVNLITVLNLPHEFEHQVEKLKGRLGK